MREFKVFWRYFLRYITILLIVIIGIVPFVVASYNVVKNIIIAQTVSKLEAGMLELENDIETMYMISTILNDNQHLNTIKQIEGSIPMEQYLLQKYLMGQLMDINSMNDFSPMMFVLFRDNDSFISSSQVSDNFSDYYGEFFEINSIDEKELKNHIFSNYNGNFFIHAPFLKYYSKQILLETSNAILYVMPIRSDNITKHYDAAVIFILEEDTILNKLLTKECKESGFIRITDSFDNTILSYGEDVVALEGSGEIDKIVHNNNQYLLFNYNQQFSGLKATVGYPLDLIYGELSGLIQMVFLFAIYGLIGAFLLAIAFTIHWYKPLHRVLQTIPNSIGFSMEKVTNEYDYIRESLIKLVSDKDEYRTRLVLADAQKQAILLENLFIRGIYTKEELNEFQKYFPSPITYFCVAIMKVDVSETNKDENTIFLYAVEYIKRKINKPFVNVHSTTNTEIFLFPFETNEAENLDLIYDSFMEMAVSLTEDLGALTNIGISSIGNDISEINIEYSKARQVAQACYQEHANSISIYRLNKREVSIINIEFINKLYNLLLGGERELISNELEKLRNNYIKHREYFELNKEDLFFSIRNVITCVYHESALLSSEVIEIPEYNQKDTAEEYLDLLEQTIYRICDYLDDNRKSKNIELKDRIIQYLKENYRKQDLTANMVCNNMGISEKYLFNFIKEHTGKTFLSYLDELRIEKSIELLIKTNLSNDQIAEEAGFGATNTFYRTFKKYIGMSPGAYRKSKIE